MAKMCDDIFGCYQGAYDLKGDAGWVLHTLVRPSREDGGLLVRSALDWRGDRALRELSV
jgi:hypothetical protein